MLSSLTTRTNNFQHIQQGRTYDAPLPYVVQ